MVTNLKFVDMTCSQLKMLGISRLIVFLLCLGYFNWPKAFNNRARKFMCSAGQGGIFFSWTFLLKLMNNFVGTKDVAVSLTSYFLLTLVVSLYLFPVSFTGLQNTRKSSATPCQYIVFLEGPWHKCFVFPIYHLLIFIQIVEYSCLHVWILILMLILCCYGAFNPQEIKESLRETKTPEMIDEQVCISVIIIFSELNKLN